MCQIAYLVDIHCLIPYDIHIDMKYYPLQTQFMMNIRVIGKKQNIAKLKKKCHQYSSLIFCSGHMVL